LFYTTEAQRKLKVSAPRRRKFAFRNSIKIQYFGKMSDRGKDERNEISSCVFAEKFKPKLFVTHPNGYSNGKSPRKNF